MKKILILSLLFVSGWMSAQTVDLNKENRDPEYVQSIVNRSQKIVDKLGLTDAKVAGDVRNIIANRYFELNDIYEVRDAKVKKVKESGLTGEAKNEALKAAENEKDAALYRSHFAFPADLSLFLTEKQIEAVKDGMTYGVVKVTYDSHLDMIPTLKEEEKAQIHAWLIEAREFAMDAENSNKKHAAFGKYKGRINNYLSKRGYDLKKEREEWYKRIKAREEHKHKEYYMFTSFHEPADEGLRYLYSEDGMHWDSIPGVWLKPALGRQQLMRDPSMVRTPDGTYHLVWTTSWKGDLGFGYAHSDDLIHWSEQRMIPVMADEPTTVNVWAPEIFYDDENEQFMVVWASCIPGRFERGIEEEKNNHRLYYITTKDFKTVSKARLLYDPGFSAIDAVIVKRAKNDYVMVLKDNTRPERNLKVAFADAMTGPYSPASRSFTESFVEGPSVAKVGDEYLIYADVYRKKIYGATRTKDFRNFTDATEEVSVPAGHKHGTIFTVPESVVKALLEKKK